jgi:excinuclease ABC subunit C
LHHLDDDALPDLMLIDGGKGQLSAAMDAASRSGIVVRMASLAKEREECFVPDAPGPVPLPDRSPAKLLLMRMRDEAHRFAVGYHRNLRARSQISSALDGIEGLGEQKRTALLRRFLSVKMIRAASELELALVDGIGPRLAKRIKLSLGPG